MALVPALPTSKYVDVAGTYQLVSVAEKSLPAPTGKDDGCLVSVAAAKLTLTTDRKWTLEQTERRECGKSSRDELKRDHGTYQVSGDNVTFLDDDGERNTGGTADADIDIDELDQGTLTGTTLTVRLEEGQSLVFKR